MHSGAQVSGVSFGNAGDQVGAPGPEPARSKSRRGRGCHGHPAFPTPSVGRKIHQRLGPIARRDRKRMSGVEMSTLVMPGLDPGIHQSSQDHFSKKMDCRVEPGNDGVNGCCLKIESELCAASRRSAATPGTPGAPRSGFPSPAPRVTKNPGRRRPAPSPATDLRRMFPA